MTVIRVPTMLSIAAILKEQSSCIAPQMEGLTLTWMWTVMVRTILPGVVQMIQAGKVLLPSRMR